MNELYSISPDACESSREINYVLQTFGPQAGRYVVGLPQRDSWCMSVLESHADLRDIERQRLSRTLHLARIRGAVIDQGQFAWQRERPWIENAQKFWGNKENHQKIYLSDQEFDAIEEQGTKALAYFAKVSEVGDSSSNHLTTPCDAESYWRLMEVLCSISSELHFVDPYFDPLKRDRRPVFEKILKELSGKSHIRRIVFWSRYSEVMKGSNHSENGINKDAITSIIRFHFRKSAKPVVVALNFLEDEMSAEKLHARYLVTNRGGIIFDQGFQMLSDGKRAHVYAMGTSVREDQFSKLSKGLADMPVREEIIFNSKS